MDAQDHNTLLIDDSPLKAVDTPFNAVHPPTWTPFPHDVRRRVGYREYVEPRDLQEGRGEVLHKELMKKIKHEMAIGGRLLPAPAEQDGAGAGRGGAEFCDLCRFLDTVKVRPGSGRLAHGRCRPSPRTGT